MTQNIEKAIVRYTIYGSYKRKTFENEEDAESISPIRQSKRKICVAQYDEQGNFVTAYSSCREAAKENNLTFQVICECVNGKRKTSYGGFIWKKLIENS